MDSAMSTPRIENAPGLTWAPLKGGWEARWRARPDLVRKGFAPKSARLWAGPGEPDDYQRKMIAAQCERLQGEMLVWARGGVRPIAPDGRPHFDGTWKSLLACYRTHRHSPYLKLRYDSRCHYDRQLALIGRERFEIADIAGYRLRTLAETRTSDIMDWHAEWVADGKVSMGHSLMTMIRLILNFGSAIMEEDDGRLGGHCARLAGKLSKVRIKQGKPRDEVLTTEQVIAIRAKAHELGRPSIALASACQCDFMFRQRDIIGEWVPLSEPGIVDAIYIDGAEKWLRGLRWEEIDQDMRLTHVTSKRSKEVVIDLRLADMVMEELRHRPGFDGTRSSLPAKGPVIVSERTQQPYVNHKFRRAWRKIATAAGIPAHVQNRDTRAGAITEADRAGVPLTSIQQAATHGDIAMTQRYNREAPRKIAQTMEGRRNLRNKERNQGGQNASGTDSTEMMQTAKIG